jgi:hypothetical protein
LASDSAHKSSRTLDAAAKINHAADSIKNKRPKSDDDKDDDDDDKDDDEVPDSAGGRGMSYLDKLNDPVFELFIVAILGIGGFLIYKVYTNRFKVRKAVDVIRGEDVSR